MDKIVSLAKRRGFVYPSSEIYGGLANAWDYGPMGVELKNNIKTLWWDRFVHRRADIVGLDAALIMNPEVWKASGHLKEFSDPLVECKKCHSRFRAGDLGFVFKIGRVDSYEMPVCQNCGEREWTLPGQFNLMLKTFLGAIDPIENLFAIFSAFNKSKTLDNLLSNKEYKEAQAKYLESLFYFRPETAQAMFVDFKNVLDSTRVTLPFGIAQIGKAFRNEITPGNFIFRTREFEQMEIEYFIPKPVRDEDWTDYFEMWRKEMRQWIQDVGIDSAKVHDIEIPDGERAHYSKRTIDFEYDFPFGRKELYGLAYRGDFDLKNHYKEAPYRDRETGEAFWPHVIEPSFGVDRTFLAVMLSAYTEDGDRVYLKLKPTLAPYTAAVFPLLANKPELVKLAREIYADLRKEFMVAWDDRGNIGKRYYAQDEVGTPYCITVDFDSLEDKNVTVRNRDTATQERMAVAKLAEFLAHEIRS